jgi:hypothetical protein
VILLPHDCVLPSYGANGQLSRRVQATMTAASPTCGRLLSPAVRRSEPGSPGRLSNCQPTAPQSG